MKKLMPTAVLLVSLFSLAACTAENAEPTGSSESKIIGGSSDPGHPSVGLLRSVLHVHEDGRPAAVSECTATLIAPQVMVTAAHCVQRGRLWDEVSFEPVPTVGAHHGAPGWISAALIAHPQFDGDSSHGHDVAVVLLLARPERPLVPLAAPPPVGTMVTAVGYGMNVYGNDAAGSGERRAVDIPLLGVAAHELVAGRDGQGTCHGDSGGPLFADGALVGITSYGDTADCHGSNHFMRVDDNVDFLRRFTPTF